MAVHRAPRHASRHVHGAGQSYCGIRCCSPAYGLPLCQPRELESTTTRCFGAGFALVAHWRLWVASRIGHSHRRGHTCVHVVDASESLPGLSAKQLRELVTDLIVQSAHNDLHIHALDQQIAGFDEQSAGGVMQKITVSP
jgi:hypothetical protein